MKPKKKKKVIKKKKKVETIKTPFGKGLYTPEISEIEINEKPEGTI